MSLDNQAREHVERTAQAVGVSSEKLNLDSQGRAGSKLIVGDDYVACFGSELSSMNYYGGMEYHPEDYVHRMGDLIIFAVSGEDECRVKESLLHWEEEGRAEHENEKEKGN